MSIAMSGLRKLLMVLACVLGLVSPSVWSRSQAEVVACPKSVAVEILQLNHKQVDQPNQPVIQPKAPSLQIPLTAVGLAMDQLPKQPSDLKPNGSSRNTHITRAVYQLNPNTPLSLICSYQFGLVSAYVNATSMGTQCVITEKRDTLQIARVTKATLTCQ